MSRWDSDSIVVPPLTISPWASCALGRASGISLSSGTWPTANVAVLYPFRLSCVMIAQQVWWINGAAATGNVDCGCYDLDGNLLFSAGSTAQSGTNAFQGVTLGAPVRLGPGLFYVAMVASSGSSSFMRMNPAGGATALRLLGMAQIAATALPLSGVNPATLATLAQSIIPMCGFATEVL